MKPKKISIFSLKEVKTVLVTFLITAISVAALYGVAIQRWNVEAELKIQREEEESRAAEEAAVRYEAERKAAEKKFEERKAAGPVALNTDSNNESYYDVLYSIANDEISIEPNGSNDYSTLIDLSKFNAYNGEGDFDFCYPSNFYKDFFWGLHASDPLPSKNVINFYSKDGSRLVVETWPRAFEEGEKSLNDAYKKTQKYFEISTKETGSKSDRRKGLLFWEGTDSLSKGVISAKPYDIFKLTVICPPAVDEQDEMYKQFYMDSLINLCGFSFKDGKTMTWDDFCAK